MHRSSRQSTHHAVLIDIGFVLYPVLYMVSTMMMTLNDLVDPTVIWVPTEIALRTSAHRVHRHGIHAGIGPVCTCVDRRRCRTGFHVCARWYGLSLPLQRQESSVCDGPVDVYHHSQTIIIPLFLLNRHLGWLNTNWALVVPEMFGLGLKGALFVIIYRQFFLGFQAH